MDTPLGSLCQCLATQGDKVFPDFQRESPMFQYVSIASFPLTGHHWKEPNTLLFAPSLWVFADIGKIPLSLLFPGWTVPALSLSKDVPVSYLSLKHSAAVFPIYPCLSHTEEPLPDRVLQVWPHLPWEEQNEEKKQYNTLSIFHVHCHHDHCSLSSRYRFSLDSISLFIY